MTSRRYTAIDECLMQVDSCLSALFATKQSKPARPSPANNMPEPDLSIEERRHVAGLMRVNHAGEVAAQALYQGQALTSREAGVQASMQEAAREEIDHLHWCRQRLNELGSHPSRLDPFWYTGSFLLGSLAGIAGDRWSLGFVAETERQVVEHLQSHLGRLPVVDQKSRAILEQMAEDEARHGQEAAAIGGIELPLPIKQAMRICSRIMTRTAYYI